MTATESRRRLSELHARHASNLQRWRADELEFVTERARIQAECEHTNKRETAGQYHTTLVCQDCGKILEALVGS